MAASWASPVQAGMIFTPSISTGVGYDDNVRQQKARRGDSFVTVRPAATLETGSPANQLQISASAAYEKYSRLTNYDGLQSADITARWRYLPSSTWAFDVYNSFSTSYDFAELNEFGAITQLSPTTGRRDRDTVGARATHLLGPGGSQITAGTSYTITRNENPTQEDQVNYHADLGLAYRINPTYRANFNLGADFDDYQRSADVERGSAEARLAYLFNSHDEVWAGVVVGASRSLSNNGTLTQGRDYTTYSPRLGFKKVFSPQWDMEGYGGATYVKGDDTANSAAGEFSPVGSLQVTYRQKLWLLRLYSTATMSEQQSLGQNTGLVDRKQAGANLEVRPDPRWRYSVGADWAHDDYKQNSVLAGTTAPQGYTEYWRAYGLASYQFTQHWSVKLDYRYVTRINENDVDNLEQNRIVLSLDYELPFKW